MKTRLELLELERRDMLSASVALTHGVLTIAADNRGDYIVVQQPTPQITEVLIASEAGKTYDFPSANVQSIAFQGGAGDRGDYFANLTALPSIQKAGDNQGVNYLQGGTGNDTLIGSPNKKAQNYLTDPAGSNQIFGGAGFTNIFLGTGSETVTLGQGYTGLYSILARNTIYANPHGQGYLILNKGSVLTHADHYQIVTFFQPGVSGNSPGVPGGPSAVLQPDQNGNGILYLNAASAQKSTFFIVNQTKDQNGKSQLVVTYIDQTNGKKTWIFPRASVSWIASFGPTGSNNTIVDNSDANDVLYGGLPGGNHILVGGRGALSVIKGHSGFNTIIARARYNDVTAGTGTDRIAHIQSPSHGPGAQGPVGDIFRINLGSTVNGFRDGDVVNGIPRSINGTRDNDTDATPDNADYVFWALFLMTRNSI